MVAVRSEIYNIIGAMPDGEKPEEIGVPLTFYSLSKEDVRQDVNEDEYASDRAIRLVINKARKALEFLKFPYEIETVQGRGYRLRALETNVSNLGNS